jgi:hypothetical protein
MSIFSNLTKINLTGNDISEVYPNDISNEATEIFLAGNKFVGQVNFIPSSIIHYNVDNNDLEGSLPGLSSTTIKTCNVANNNFSGNVPNLSSCTLLVKFIANDNSFTGVAQNFLVDDSLIYLDLSNNNLSSGAIDRILGALVEAGASNGYVDLTGSNNGTRSATTGAGYVTTLTGSGWTVNVNT